MIQEINKLINNNLTANQLLILEGLAFNKALLQDYSDINSLDVIEVVELMNRGYIISSSGGTDVKNLLITKDGMDLITELGKWTNIDILDNELFTEFWNTYPSKYGERALKSSKEKCLKKYEQILKKGFTKDDNNKVYGKDYHDLIIRALQKEESARTKTLAMGKFFPDPCGITVYLNNEKWIGYISDNIDPIFQKREVDL